MTREAIEKLLDNDDQLFEYILKKDAEWEYYITYNAHNFAGITNLYFEYSYIDEYEEEASFTFIIVLNSSIFTPDGINYEWLDTLLHLPRNKLREVQVVKLRLTYLFWYIKNKLDNWVCNNTKEMQQIEGSKSRRVEVWAYPGDRAEPIQFKIKV